MAAEDVTFAGELNMYKVTYAFYYQFCTRMFIVNEFHRQDGNTC